MRTLAGLRRQDWAFAAATSISRSGRSARVRLLPKARRPRRSATAAEAKHRPAMFARVSFRRAEPALTQRRIYDNSAQCDRWSPRTRRTVLTSMPLRTRCRRLIREDLRSNRTNILRETFDFEAIAEKAVSVPRLRSDHGATAFQYQLLLSPS